MTNAEFKSRHIGPRDGEIQQMLEVIGVSSIEELINKTVPSNIRLNRELNVPKAMSEFQFIKHLKALGGKNKLYKSYLGLGYHGTKLPGVIQRNILENPGWYTAYTPYQAEIAQGRLEALLNFQTMVTDLTGMEIANASLLDESTAAAEAMIMFYSSRSKVAKKNEANQFFVSQEVLPQTISLLQTRAEPLDIELVIGDHQTFEFTSKTFGAIVQYPAINGEVYNYRSFAQKVKDNDAFLVVAADIMSLAILEAPGKWGADAVVGTTQRFGIPMGYGGPHAAYFATKDEYKRNIPGRIIGVSVDASGNRALRMALQTREQHIKRDRATSNICTAQVLLAVMSGMYACYHGAEGIRAISTNIHKYTNALSIKLNELGFKNLNTDFFDTIQINTAKYTADQIVAAALIAEINIRKVDDSTVSISLDETVEMDDLNELLHVFAKLVGSDVTISRDEIGPTSIHSSIQRTTPYLTHEVFNQNHSETDMMRYIKSLENKDLSLTHSMIALGSCTMKLNAASELFALSWPEFNNLHPFVPIDQAEGYTIMLHNLERYLSEITGFAQTSLQPNSGAQGEYAGLMVIRAYHIDRGDHHRNIALIPSSAHGTNPASAVMAGMKVVVVKCDERGNIDVADLQEKAEKHSNELSCLMITYPSTHGVFESSVKDITKIIHQHGGQVYMDGANMNAQVGLTNPAEIGADVCHLNLHKTFAIPHGGGGPGMGPIGVAAHLAPFLPSNPMVTTGGDKAITSISGAPFGSALVLTISYAYIRMLGAIGLRNSTEFAILNANYMRVMLEEKFDVLYKGENGFVAHEMILDCRGFKAKSGIEVVDIAKRLMDYGYHAPTVSFPVGGTLMIEPTESESKKELDQFIKAMLSIYNEIEGIENGIADKANNVLKNAPHILSEVVSESWDYPYTRTKAVFPLSYIQANKFWPTVKRVDDAFGDRNLICSCAPIQDYEEPVLSE
jgi:glycine dehydrogenase